MKIKKLIQLYLSKIKFAQGLSPVVDRFKISSSFFIPPTYKAVCLISADFELAWAFRFSKSNNYPLEKALKKATISRKNIPKILNLAEKFQIPITWATVGHLFLTECVQKNGTVHPEIKRLPYFENEFWKYTEGDWFKDDPCTNYLTDPGWYCPDLIKKIVGNPIEHELGCHTFSHIDCRDKICAEEVFLSEIHACKKAAERFSLTFKSFVHPGHQIGNLQSLFNEGFTSFRTDYGDTLSFPVKHSSGLWELKNTAGIEYREGWSVKYHIKRYTTIIKRAIKNKKVCVLWFHPSFNSIVPDKILPEIFKFLYEHQDEIWITTHNEYIKWLNKNLNKN